MKFSLFFLRSITLTGLTTRHTFNVNDQPVLVNLSSRCKHSYTCNAVIGRVHYNGGNRSELVQIYATYDESEKYTGAV